MVNEHDSDKAAGTGTGAVAGAALGGVAAGATTGMLAGGVTGPVGAVIGAAVGAVAGAIMGNRAADPDTEDKYWRENHATTAYGQDGLEYEHYSPAYRTGVESYSRNPDRSFDDVEPELRQNWGSARGNSSLDWDRARPAARSAWDRVSNAAERAIPGDSDRDGR